MAEIKIETKKAYEKAYYEANRDKFKAYRAQRKAY